MKTAVNDQTFADVFFSMIRPRNLERRPPRLPSLRGRLVPRRLLRLVNSPTLRDLDENSIH